MRGLYPRALNPLRQTPHPSAMLRVASAPLPQGETGKSLLARPHDPRDPLHVGGRQRAVGVARFSDCSSSVLAVRRFNSRTITSPARGFHHHAVAAPDRRARRHHDDVAVAIDGLHRVAGNFQRIGVLVVTAGSADLVPALAGRKAASSKWPRSPACAKPSSGTDCTVRAASPINCTKLSIELLVAASALEINSVEGQRSRPSGRDALGFVEGGGIEAGFFRQARSRRPGALGQTIQRGPDLVVGQRCAALSAVWPWRGFVEFRNYYLNRPISATWRKRPDSRPLSCAGAADTVARQIRRFRGNPKKLNDKQD